MQRSTTQTFQTCELPLHLEKTQGHDAAFFTHSLGVLGMASCGGHCE